MLTRDMLLRIIKARPEKERAFMLDKNDLQMIQEIIVASEQRMSERIEATEQRMSERIEASEQRMSEKIDEAESRMKVMMESYFDPKFNLLFENQQIMMEQLAPRSRVDELEDEVKFLKSIVRQMNDEIQQLKKAI